MKRILILALVAMLVVVMLAVPSFAAENEYIFSPDDVLDQPLPAGHYSVELRFYIGGNDDSDYVISSSGFLTVDPHSDEYWAYASIDFEFEGKLCSFDLDFLGDGPVSVDCMIDGVRGDPLITSIRMRYEPVAPEVEESMDTVGTFFTGVLGWLQSLGKLFEQPLFLLFAVCVPLIGFGIWGLSKLKNS